MLSPVTDRAPTKRDHRWKGGPKITGDLRKKRNRDHIIRAKSKPCADCKFQYPYWVMQFDHLDPFTKRFTLGDLRHSYSLKRIQAEIDKCEVVCSNCHLERSHRQRQMKEPDIKFNPAGESLVKMPRSHQVVGIATRYTNNGATCEYFNLQTQSWAPIK